MPEKILIVDDDLDTLKLVGLILQRHGYQIAAANGGHQALTKAASEKPDMILLDLMMPDLDGYEVTRRLRADPSTAQTPIIMFTAKTLLDDKVAGFEAGADDYLTKPTHPAELIAHVKALMARSKTSRSTAPLELARVVGFIGAKGGVGTTTLVTNVAAVASKEGQDIVLADLYPGSGSLGLMLGLAQTNQVSPMLTKPVGELNPRAVSGQFVSHPSGLRVLPAAAAPRDAGLAHNAAQMETIVKSAMNLCKLLLLDLGTGLNESNRRIASLCDYVVVVSDPTRVSLAQTKSLLNDLTVLGLSGVKVDVVIVNRAPATNQLSWQQIEQMLSQKVSLFVTQAVELAYQASDIGNPIVLLRPDSVTADQLRNLAKQVFQRVGSSS